MSLFLSLAISGSAQANPGLRIPYSTIFYGAKPPPNVAYIIEKNIGDRVKKIISADDYELIVFAEANAVTQRQQKAYVCSVTLGFSRKANKNHLIPNIRFNSIGFSLDNGEKEKTGPQWEQRCIENSLSKALSDLSKSDLDYLKFMADK